ncbi:hypothetical protein BH18THE2_BH18THE2_25160 [soil metagenome]
MLLEISSILSTIVNGIRIIDRIIEYRNKRQEEGVTSVTHQEESPSPFGLNVAGPF